MLKEWAAEFAFAYSQVPEADRNSDTTLKIFAWPEWTWRARQGDSPLSVAEKDEIEKGISDEILRKSDTGERIYSQSLFIVPGTIYYGAQVPAENGLSTSSTVIGNGAHNDAPPTCDARDPSSYTASKASWAGKWLMFNCLPKFNGKGVNHGSHCKASECENKAANELWGRCAVIHGVADKAVSKAVSDVLPIAPSFVSSKVISNGVHYGADICLDHVTANAFSGKAIDSSWYPGKDLDVQVVISNGMRITPTRDASAGEDHKADFSGIIRNLPVKTGGYVLIADGGSGLPTADNAGLYHVGGTADAPVFTFVKGESRSLDIPPNKNVGARTIRIAVYKSVELPK